MEVNDMAEYSRRDERMKTMQAFYQIFLAMENHEEYDATSILPSIYCVSSFDKCPAFSQLIYVLGLDNFDAIKANISSHLVNWTFDRLDNVCKAILFVAVSEGCYLKKTPRKVVISEAVILAKNFLKVDDHKFVNALLDKAIDEYECA